MLGIICQDEWQEKYAKEPGELGELKNGLRSEDSLENWREQKRDIRTKKRHKNRRAPRERAKDLGLHCKICSKKILDVFQNDVIKWGKGRRSCLWRTWKLSKCLFDFSRFTGTRSNSLAAFLVSPFNRLTAPCHRKVHRKLLNESLSASLQFGSFLFWSFSARSSCNFYGRFFQFSWGVF